MTEQIKQEPTPTPPAPETPKPGLLSNVLAIIGLIILIVIVVWGLVHLISLSTGWFSGNSNTASSIQVTAPTGASSGSSFSISWKYTPPAKGSYAFMFQCKPGLRMGTPASAPTQAGGQVPVNEIPCGASYTINPANNTLTLLPLLSGSSSVPVQLTVLYLPSATSTKGAQGSATVTISPANGTPQTGTTTTPVAVPTTPQIIVPISSTQPAQPGAQAAYRGSPDLAVRIISITTDASGVTRATFDIANDGGSPSGVYYFEANLPTLNPYTYRSPLQASLAPGAHILNTLTFTQTVPGTFQVIVDPANLVREPDETNNILRQSISGGAYYQPQGYYPQQGYYQQQQYQYIY